jgi:hypothetical protein
MGDMGVSSGDGRYAVLSAASRENKQINQREYDDVKEAGGEGERMAGLGF